MATAAGTRQGWLGCQKNKKTRPEKWLRKS